MPEIRTFQQNQATWDFAISKGKETPPTDDITLGFWEAHWLNKRWMKGGEGSPVPADIFFAKTIPLPSVTINIKMPTEQMPKFALRAKVIILEDLLNNITPGQTAIVGAISFGSSIHKKEDWMILKIEEDNTLSFATDKKIMDELQAANRVDLFIDLVARCLCAWYGVQISLLHPTLKCIFEHPRMAPLMTKRKHSNKKRKTGYIRKHKIEMDELDKALFPAMSDTKGKTHVITCPVWWVIGHWHTYNGKKKWVNGYWKGVLKDAKRNLDEGRDRDIDTKDICLSG